MRTGPYVPAVTRPSRQLVVNEEVASNLRSFPNIRLVPVRFTKLINLNFSEDNIPKEIQKEFPFGRDFIIASENDERLHGQIGLHFEVQCFRLIDVSPLFPETPFVNITTGMPDDEEIDECQISEEMLKQFPLLSYGDLICHPDLFSVFATHVDNDFFITRRFVV